MSITLATGLAIKLLKLLLLPIAALFELALLTVSWVLVLVSPRLAGHIIALGKRLPGTDWYLGRE